MDEALAYLTPSYRFRDGFHQLGYAIYVERDNKKALWGFYPVRNLVIEKEPDKKGDMAVTINDSSLQELANDVALLAKPGFKYCGFKYADHDELNGL